MTKREKCDLENQIQNGNLTQLIQCYENHEVEFDKRYCDVKFEFENNSSESEQLLDCYVNKAHLTVDRAICDEVYKVDENKVDYQDEYR